MNSERIALVTGANKGIGLQVARELALLGYTVLIGARSKTLGMEVAAKFTEEGFRAVFIPIDVTDPSTISVAARDINERFGRLDVLINNAGICLDAGLLPSQVSLEILRKTFDTNVFGAFSVLQTMLPLLRKSVAARVVNMSSGLGSLTLNSDPNYEFAQFKLLAYNASKTALNAMTVQFAHELKGSSIKINSADPGFTATDLNGHRGIGTTEQAASIVLRLATLPESGPNGGFFDQNGQVPW
ncbi:MAG: SDR family oxidoreductase [Sulfurospirillaceae bacterium]|nr:SDR family oxidoreductase [Sulfurospirillaceae bacterium]